MKPGGRRLTKEKIGEIIKLLKEGYSSNSIAKKYGMDHTSILWHKKKWGIKVIPTKSMYVKNEPKPQPPLNKYQKIVLENDGPENLGKNYLEYLNERNQTLQPDERNNGTAAPLG